MSEERGDYLCGMYRDMSRKCKAGKYLDPKNYDKEMNNETTAMAGSWPLSTLSVLRADRAISLHRSCIPTHTKSRKNERKRSMKNRIMSMIAIIGAVIGGILIARARTNPPADTVAMSDNESGSTSDNEIAPLLRSFFAAMNRIGDNAQQLYEEALAALRSRPENTIAEIMRAERMTDEEDYSTRWALVHAASELRNPVALPYLRNLVQTRIPHERSRNPHSFSTVTEETILRTTAIEGVEHLAVAGNNDAIEALFEFLEQPSLSIRRASVQAILATREGQSLRARVAVLLPQDQQFLLDIRRVDVREVPQINNPQKYLATTRREKTNPPPAPGRGSASRFTGRNSPPRIS